MEKSNKWNQIIETQNGHPLQLYGWGEVKESTGSWQAERFVRASADNTINFAQILIRSTPLGKFGYIPRGQNLNDTFLQELRVFAKQKNLFMLRFEPNVKAEDWKIWRFMLEQPKDHILLAKTVQLDLTKSEGELLAAMDGTTRQNIRRGERNPALVVRKATNDDIDRILAIYHETAARSHFALHPDDYYHSILHNMGENNHIYVAEVDGRVEAFLWCVKTPAICFELYGGATSIALEHRANYLLKWQTILGARGDSGCEHCGVNCRRQEGCQRPAVVRTTGITSHIYDINGLLNDGISDFKRGFSGGVETQLAPTSDLVIKPFRYFLFATFLPLAKRFFKLGK